MSWRELWRNAVANVRNLLSAFDPTPRTPPPRPSLARPTPQALLGPVPPAQRPEAIQEHVMQERRQAQMHRATPWVDAAAPEAAPPSDLVKEARATTALLSPAVTVVESVPASEPSADGAGDTWEDGEQVEVSLDVSLVNASYDAELAAEDVVEPPDDGEAVLPAPDDDNPPGQADARWLLAVLESLLFVAAEPVEAAYLAKTLGLPPATVEQGLQQLAEEYKTQGRGLRLQLLNNRLQLVSAPEAAPYIEQFLNLDNSTKLSSAALETLAVIAYRQPVTRTQIEAIRGVDCAAVLRSLTQRGLITEAGRLETIGRPILYGVTELFMQHFGLSALSELPPLEETEADRLWAATLLAEGEGRTEEAEGLTQRRGGEI